MINALRVSVASSSDQNKGKNKKIMKRRVKKEGERGRGVGKHHLSLSHRKSQTSAAYFVEESERTRGFPRFTCPSVSSPT